jgi:hypothetical protein
MEPVLTEEALKEHTKKFELEEAIEIILRKAERILEPVANDYHLYAKFLEREAYERLKNIKNQTLRKDVKTSGRHYGLYMERKEQIDELGSIVERWQNFSFKEKLINTYLVDQYDKYIRNIKLDLKLDTDNGIYPSFQEELRKHIMKKEEDNDSEPISTSSSIKSLPKIVIIKRGN